MTFTERSARPAIERAPRTASEQRYDLVVIGGGIHGACVALEATQRGARVLLVEQADFGGATSHNSHRVIHGGLRYLQSLDLSRVRESIRCRQWFMDHFPELVRPLPCLMPLYGVGLRRPSAFRAALAVHRGLARLSGARIDGPDRGRILDTGEVLSWAPHLQSSSLRGGGLWYDAVMVNPARLLMELLRWACDAGATVLNYVEAVALERRGDRIDGVVAADRVTQETMVFRTRKVINCAGPWTRRLAAEFDQDMPSMGTLALAFGMLVDRGAPSSAALAVSANSDTKATCFLVPWGSSRHCPWR